MILRRLRARFGIAARHVAVRTDVPWHWRVLVFAFTLSMSVVLGTLAYDQFRQLLRSERGDAGAEVSGLQKRVAELERQLASPMAGAAIEGSELQIERKTLVELARQIKTLQAENG